MAQHVKPGWTSHGGQRSGRETARSSPHCATSACSHHPSALLNLPVGLDERPAGESDDITHELVTEFTLSEAQIWRPSRRRDVGGTDPQPPPGSGQTRGKDNGCTHPPVAHASLTVTIHRLTPASPADPVSEYPPTPRCATAASPIIERQASDMPPRHKQHPQPLPYIHPKEVAGGLADSLTD